MVYHTKRERERISKQNLFGISHLLQKGTRENGKHTCFFWDSYREYSSCLARLLSLILSVFGTLGQSSFLVLPFVLLLLFVFFLAHRYLPGYLFFQFEEPFGFQMEDVIRINIVRNSIIANSLEISLTRRITSKE